MPARSPGARHRKGNATPKPRLIVGLALPTAAAMALIVTAAGAAMATSPKTQTFIRAQSAFAAAVQQPAVVQPDAIFPNPVTASEAALDSVRRDQAVARAAAADRVSRSVAREKLAAKARVAKATKARVAKATKARAAKALAVRQAAHAHSWRLPITNPVETSGFGYRWGRLHAGKDFAVSTGTKLTSMSSGTVDFAGVKGGYGNLVRLRYWDGTISYYGHMSSIAVHAGQRVTPGQVVGRSGNTGHSTGPHLHLEIHPNGGAAVNPGPWLTKHKVTW